MLFFYYSIFIYSNISVEEMIIEQDQWRLYEMQAHICKIFSDPKRLLLLKMLREGEKSVGELATALGLHQANVSQHLAVMREGGIVISRRQGTSVYYSLSSSKIADACDMVRDVLAEQLERNQALVNGLRVR